MQLIFDFAFDLPLHLAADVVAAVDVVVVALLSRVVLVHRSSAALTRIRLLGLFFSLALSWHVLLARSLFFSRSLSWYVAIGSHSLLMFATLSSFFFQIGFVNIYKDFILFSALRKDNGSDSGICPVG